MAELRSGAPDRVVKPRVLLAALNAPDLRLTLQAASSELPYVYLESETRVVLMLLAAYLEDNAQTYWTQGRAFGPELEIRWRRDDLSFDVQSLCEDDRALPGWTPSDWKLDTDAQPRDVLLAGLNVAALPKDHPLFSTQGGVWIAESIARPLLYPIRDRYATRVVLRCLDYRSGGRVVITRLCDLAAYQPKAEPD